MKTPRKSILSQVLAATIVALSGATLLADPVLNAPIVEPPCGNEAQGYISGPGIVPVYFGVGYPDKEHIMDRWGYRAPRLLRWAFPDRTGRGTIRPDTVTFNREIPDLEVWGGVGEHPMVWKRYYSSRPPTSTIAFGEALGWRHGFEWTITEIVPGDTNGFHITYPDGTRLQFWDGYEEGGVPYGYDGIWRSSPAVTDQLVALGQDMMLQRQNGWRYRLSKHPDFGWQVVGLWDSQQNYYSFSYDASGRFSRFTEPAGRYLQATYNENNWITRVDGSDGRFITYTYAQFNNATAGEDPVWTTVLASVQYGDGSAAAFQYLAGGWPLLTNAYEPRSINGPVHVHLLYWNSVGYFRAEVDPVSGRGIRGVGLDTNTWAKTIYSANGAVEPFVAGWGMVLNRSNGEGEQATYTYENGAGYLTSKTDALNRTTHFTNSSLGSPLAITYPDSAVESWTRDALELVLTSTDPLGRVTTFTRDTRHRVSRVDYPDGSYETFTYNTNSQVLTHRLRSGGVETFAYDTRGLKTAHTNALGHTTTFAYDAFDRPSAVTDARGYATTNLYNWRGQLVRVMHPDGHFRSNGYDAAGNKNAETNELGAVTLLVHDNFRRLVSSTDALNRTTSFVFAEFGGHYGTSQSDKEPAVITSPSTNVAVNLFDLAGRKVGTIAAYGTAHAATNLLAYDDGANVIAQVDPNGGTITNYFDLRGRRVASAGSLGHTNSCTFDAAGNKLTETQANGAVTTFAYDASNRATNTVDALGRATRSTFDLAGNLTSLTDARGNSYGFTYDLLGRKLSMTFPDSSQETWTYDAVGNVTNHVTRAGQVKASVFDSRNREISYSWSDGSPGVARTYDAVGHLLTANNGVSLLSNAFDAAGQLVSETQLPLALNTSWTITYTYDAEGNRRTVSYPGGLTITNAYTARNQLASLYTGLPAPTAAFTYDRVGNRLSKILENGTTNVQTFDVLNRLTSATHLNGGGTLGSFNYGYDSVHRRTHMQVDGALGDAYGYDLTDQVTSVQYDATNPGGSPSNPVRTVSYGYDPVGNRTNVTDNGSGTSYTANNLNQYTAVGGASPTYDANGNLTNYNGWAYVYDAQNRLWGAASTNTTGIFTYDAKNRVVSRAVNGVTNFYFYDGWSLAQETTVAGSVLQTYVHGPRIDELVFKTDGSNTVYYHFDALGNVTHLTSTTGAVVERYRYDIYGQASIRDGAGNLLATSACNNRLLFSGREYLADFGIYDYRNRVYLAAWGRFIQTDPIRFDAKDVNIYRYCHNQPLSTTDPTGLSDAIQIGVVGGIIGALGGAGGNALKQAGEMSFNSKKEFDASDFWVSTAKGACLGILGGYVGYVGAIGSGSEAILSSIMFDIVSGASFATSADIALDALGVAGLAAGALYAELEKWWQEEGHRILIGGYERTEFTLGAIGGVGGESLVDWLADPDSP